MSIAIAAVTENHMSDNHTDHAIEPAKTSGVSPPSYDPVALERAHDHANARLHADVREALTVLIDFLRDAYGVDHPDYSRAARASGVLNNGFGVAPVSAPGDIPSEYLAEFDETAARLDGANADTLQGALAAAVAACSIELGRAKTLDLLARNIGIVAASEVAEREVGSGRTPTPDDVRDEVVDVVEMDVVNTVVNYLEERFERLEASQAKRVGEAN